MINRGVQVTHNDSQRSSPYYRNATMVAEQGAHVAPEKASSKKGATQKKGAPKGQKSAKGNKAKASPKKEAKAGKKAAKTAPAGPHAQPPHSRRDRCRHGPPRG